MNKCISIRVHGQVQGVYFRASTRDVAKKLGLTGFVQNEKGGTVYLEACGPEDKIRELKEWCGKGPAAALVLATETEELPLKELPAFEIRR